MAYEVVIGLEVHAQLLTNTKVFCPCPTGFGAEPNSQICPVCTGQPGALPVLNREVVTMTIRAGHALGCAIRTHSVFARKNYFYPDLPKGYQISQFEYPICEEGTLAIELEDESQRTIRINRIHIEEDAGQLYHEIPGVSGVDYNRCSTPLIEIVTEPDMRSAEEATTFLRSLRDILVYLEVCNGNMQEGSFRCDVNVSLRPQGQNEYGTRAEIKNMNSFRFIQDAIHHEIQRQTQLLDAGEKVVQETRLWDVAAQCTRSMRGKEEAHDYRYFPEPDLLPLVLDDAWIEETRGSLPELPLPKRNRFIQQYDVSKQDAQTLCSTRELADYFEQVALQAPSAKKACHWILRDLLGALKENAQQLKTCQIQPPQLAQLLHLLEDGKINAGQAKKVFRVLFEEGGSPDNIRQKLGFEVISDDSALLEAIQDALTHFPDQVASFRGGDPKIFGFLMGQIRKATGGKADMKKLNQLLRAELNRPEKP